MRDISLAFGDPDACWEWPGSINPNTGYGQLSEFVDGKRMLRTAHRVAFAAFNGELQDGDHVLHKCDNRPCFNPAHLVAGSHQENMLDMTVKGRRKYIIARRGELHGGAKTNAECVAAIRSAPASTPLRVLAEQFDLSRSAVCAIRNRKTWTHI